jgi:hypothetical protein
MRMIKSINSIYRIYNNPFVLTPLIVKFYEKYEGQKNDILLAYLIFPLVLHEQTGNCLRKARTTSSLHTFRQEKKNFYGLPQRIEEYKHITNQCLQYAIDNNNIEVDRNLSITVKNPKLDCVANLTIPLKASENFVKIIKDFDIVKIYKELGVKKL